MNEKDRQTPARLKKIIAKLWQSERELKKTNQLLEASNQQLMASEQAAKNYSHDLGERVKELYCLQVISESVRTKSTIEEIINDILEIIPPSWQYPEITCARITLNGKSIISNNFCESEWKMSSEIFVNNTAKGKIDVYYTQEINKLSKDPFLKEERILLKNITEQLGSIVELKLAENEIKISNNQLNALNDQLVANEQQLRASNQQLIASEKALEITEERYRNIIYNSYSCVAVYKVIENGNDFVFMDFNKTAEKLEKRTREEVIGRKVTEVFPSIRDMGLLEVFKQVWNTNIPIHHPISVYKENNIISYRENYIFKIPSGEIVAVYQDVTDRVIAKQELQFERDKLTSILETMTDGIYISNQQYEIEYINSSLIKEFGEVEGKKCYEYFHGFSKPCSFCKNEEIFAGETVQWEWTSKKNNKTYDLIGTPLPNADGSISKLEILRDITDRKNTEIEIVKLSTAVEQSPSVIAITDLDGNLEYVNPKFVELTGYSYAEVVGNNPRILKSGEQPAKMYDVLWKTITSGMAWHGEFHNKKKSGELFLESAIVSPIRNEQGVIINYLKVSEDITERKIAEESLKESEEKYRELIETTAEGFCLFDSDDRIIDVNEAICKMLEYSKDEMIGKSPFELTDAENKELLLIEASKTKIQKHRTYDVSMKTKSGSNIPTLINATTLFNNDGTVKGSFALITDISRQKRNELIRDVLYHISNAVNTTNTIQELINQIQIELGKIINTTNFYVALYNSETDTLSLPYYSDEYDSFNNVPAAKTLSKYVIETKKSLLANLELKKELAAKGKFEYQGSLSKLWLGVPIKIQGVVNGVFAVQSYTDEKAFTETDMKMLEFVSEQIGISIERKRTEQNLKAALKKATESDRLKSAFLSTISHELRTPLNAIIGFSSLISKDSPIEDILDSVSTIEESGKHLLSIVNDIFDITLIEEGKATVKKHEVNLNVVISNVYSTIKFEQKILNRVNLDLNLIVPPPGSEVTIMTDEFKIKQILINLLKNALKFTKEGYVYFGYTSDIIDNNPIIKFFVKDSGIGISKDRQEFIFEVFKQVDDEYTRTFGGLGIGLSISKKLTELLGGKIWFESIEGKGSTFYFTIPNNFTSKNENQKSSLSASKINLDNTTILLAEDDKDSFEYMRILLSRCGANILWTKNGIETVDICKNNLSIDIVLMDINMPKMNGYDATKAIKKLRPNLPIIAQTALVMSGDREKAVRAGFDEYISKPIVSTKLFEIIISLL